MSEEVNSIPSEEDRELIEFCNKEERQELNKHIRLCIYLEKYPLDNNFDGTDDIALAITICIHIKNIIQKFFPDMIFFSYNKGVKQYDFQIDSYLSFYNKMRKMKFFLDISNPEQFFIISATSFDRYFSWLSDILSSQFLRNIVILINKTENYCFDITIS